MMGVVVKPNQTWLVYEKLKERIEEGGYSPAESLLEIELASEYSVSRNTIKKVLLMLESDGLVTIEQYKGAKIRSYNKKELLDHLELRAELEGFIVRLAVPCFTGRDVQQLDEKICGQMRECYRGHDLVGYSELNHQFHAAIYQLCPNKAAMDWILRLKKLMCKYDAKTILVPGRGEDSLWEHTAILDAVKQGDAGVAEASMRIHLGNVRRTFEKYYSLLF